MSRLYILTITTGLILFFLKSAISFTPSLEFKKLTEEFVRLHLIEELPRSGDMIKTREGRSFLLAWKKKRNSIFWKIIFQRIVETNGEYRYSWYSNWRDRLQSFHKLQNDYLRDIVVDSLPKFTFDPEKLIVIEHPSQIRDDPTRRKNFVDPIATNEKIDRILRFHRPLNKLSTIAREKSKESVVIDDDLLPTDIDPQVHGTLAEREKLRLLIKKGHIIHPDLIRSLIQARYELLRRSLMGKRESDLHYQERLFLAERLIVQLDLFKLNRVFVVHPSSIINDEADYDKIVSPRLRILNDDKLYAKYMNYDDAFFKGNLLYVYKNRRDDPESTGIGFEINAERIIGKRYRPMRDLYDEIRDFDVTSDNFVKCDSTDLPMIDLLLKRVKMWTFWFSQCRFNGRQWFSIDTGVEAKDSWFMIKPPIKENTMKKFPGNINTNEEPVNLKLNHRINDHGYVDNKVNNFEAHVQDLFDVNNNKLIFNGEEEKLFVRGIFNNQNHLHATSGDNNGKNHCSFYADSGKGRFFNSKRPRYH